MTPRPWLAYYEKHVPEHVEYPDTTMPQVLQQTAADYGYRTAIIFKGARIKYGELNREVNRLAAALQELGVKPGDRVALHMPNCPQYVVGYYAVLRIGGIVVPCNPLYKAHEMTHQLRDSGAEVIITLSAMYGVVKNVRPQTRLRHVIVAQIKTYFPAALRTLFTLLMEEKKGHRVDIRGDADTHWYTDVIAKAPPRPRPVAIRPEDVAVLQYTGGTTGISKGAMLTHRNILVNAVQCQKWLNAEPAVESTMVQVPLFHVYGMTTCMNLGVLLAGTMVIVPDPRDLDDIVHTLFRYKPTLYPGVPAMYNAIVNYPDIAKYRLNSIKACISGSAGLPVEVQRKFQELTGARLVEGYGLSEASPVTHANPIFGENRIGTIGLPWPDTDVRIVDVETGERDLPIGEPGELWVRGPQVMKGYWNMPGETANVLRPDAADPHGPPWLATGDIATVDADGYFKIVDRKKEMILGAGGYNIYPREIEDVLYTHPKVLEAAAVGVPIDAAGERVKVFITLKPGQKASPEEIIAFCRENLAPFKVPKFVEFRSELPKTIVGKVLRRELLAQELDRRKASPAPTAPEDKIAA